MGERISKALLIFFILFHLSLPSFAGSSSVFRNVEALILQDAYAQAARECEEILARHHQRSIKSKAHYLLGVCQLKEGKFAQARENFNKILRRFPQSEFCDDASLGIAHSYFLSADHQQASALFEKFLQNYPRSDLTSIAREVLQQCGKETYLGNSYFSVQIGCFSKKSNAERLRDRLINCGFQAYIVELPGNNLYHIRVGKFNNRQEAEFLEQRLKSEGYPTKICP